MGQTRGGNKIYLLEYSPDSSVLREIGRLREFSFRRVKEGTGKKRDLDKYDMYYKHLVLWDSEKLEIAGAYRIGEGNKILSERGIQGFYSNSLYTFESELSPYLSQSIELGRSFVHPDYWGKASLDYLWQGIGAYLLKKPEVRYIIGPVSMSAEYPVHLMELLAFFYQKYHSRVQTLATPKNPFKIPSESLNKSKHIFAGINREQAFKALQEEFARCDIKIPVLFKQYASLYEEGGFHSLCFSVDPDFGDCMDGLCMADLTKLKESKRKRYIAN